MCTGAGVRVYRFRTSSGVLKIDPHSDCRIMCTLAQAKLDYLEIGLEDSSQILYAS